VTGFLVVRTDRGRLGLALGDVVEVAVAEGVTQVPGRHRAVRGVVQLRGRLVPLVHLRAILTDTEPPAEISDTCVLATCAGRAVALEVDEVDTIVPDPPEPVPSGWRIPWVVGVARRRGDVIPVVDAAALAGRLVAPD